MVDYLLWEQDVGGSNPPVQTLALSYSGLIHWIFDPKTRVGFSIRLFLRKL